MKQFNTLGVAILVLILASLACIGGTPTITTTPVATATLAVSPQNVESCSIIVNTPEKTQSFIINAYGDEAQYTCDVYIDIIDGFSDKGWSGDQIALTVTSPIICSVVTERDVRIDVIPLYSNDELAKIYCESIESVLKQN